MSSRIPAFAVSKVSLPGLFGIALLCLASPAAAQALLGGKPEPKEARPTPAPIQTAAPGASPEEVDRTVEKRLNSVFARVEELGNVRADVKAGVVRLEGEAGSAQARKDAEALAKRFEGVLYVDNNIEEPDEVKKQLDPTIGRLREQLRVLRARLPLMGIALLIVVAFALLAALIKKLKAPFRLFSKNVLLRGVARQVLASFLVLAGVFIALEFLEATALAGAVLGAAGLLGLAMGFAFRDILENYLASLLLGLRRPFDAGDHVVIEAHEGKVARLTTRATVLMTLEGNHVRLPNSLVFKSVIVNYTRNPLRRLDIETGIGLSEDLAHVQQVGVEILRSTKGVIPAPPPLALVEKLGESSVTVTFFAWIDQREADWFKVRSEALRRIKAGLDGAQIKMPLPAYRIEMEREGEKDRTEQSAIVAQRELSQSAHDVIPDDIINQQMRKTPDEETNLLP